MPVLNPHTLTHCKSAIYPPQIHLLCCTDSRYAAYCVVTVTSALENNREEPLSIHILTDGISKQDTIRFKRLEEKYRAEINITTIPPGIIRRIPPSNGKWAQSIYFRLFAADLLPENVTRIIYLDSDVIINCNLRPLWDTEMHGLPCAAVRDVNCCADEALTGLLSPLKALPQSSRYFNSGVMLMDIGQIRHRHINDMMLSLAVEHGSRLAYPDQDILNIAFHGRWQPLACEWNLMPWALVPVSADLSDDERQAVGQIASGASRGIIHYYAPYHPWDCRRLIFHPLEYIWERYRKLSPWRNHIRRSLSPDFMTRFHRRKLQMCWRLKIRTTYDSLWMKIPKRS